MTSRDIDNLVNSIAARVRDQLQENARSGVSNTEPCTRSKEECVGCGWSASRRPADVRAILRNGASRVAAAPEVGPVADDLASSIDHTLLKPDVTKDQLDTLCAEARKYSFASVCVNPSNVRY